MMKRVETGLFEEKSVMRLFWQMCLRWGWIAVFAAYFASCAGPSAERPKRSYSRVPLAARILVLPSEEAGKGLVTFITEIPYANMQFERQDTTYHAEINLTFYLHSPKFPERSWLIDKHYEIDTPSFSETGNPKKALRAIEKTVIETGQYEAEVTYQDFNAKKQGLYQETVLVPDFTSELYVSRPVLMWDSLTVFDPGKMIPLQHQGFDKDIFALAVVGGLSPGQETQLHYVLSDRNGKESYKQAYAFAPTSSVQSVSLRIPLEYLIFGVTNLEILVRQNKREARSMLPIRATFGFKFKYLKNVEAFLKPMQYIMSNKEWNELRKASKEEKLKIFKKYWADRDPDPETEGNPLMREFFLRVEEANERFTAHGLDGWHTDRGRVYIVYGPPDKVERRRDFERGYTLEIWTYQEIGRMFVFEDRYGNGEFKLSSPNSF